MPLSSFTSKARQPVSDKISVSPGCGKVTSQAQKHRHLVAVTQAETDPVPIESLGQTVANEEWCWTVSSGLRARVTNERLLRLKARCVNARCKNTPTSQRSFD